MASDHLSRAGAMLSVLAAWSERSSALPPLNVVEELRGLVASLPLVSVSEQLIARGFVSHHLARFSVTLERHPDISAALVAMIASPWGGDEWFGAFARLADRLESAIKDENDLGTGHSTLEVRIAKALRYIETHFDDPELTLQSVSEQVGLSPSYLAHNIKDRTGQGFVAHLRRHRVEAALRLLKETILSVKEVAAATGYSTPRQFERDFKRLNGMVPSALRHGPTGEQALAE